MLTGVSLTLVKCGVDVDRVKSQDNRTVAAMAAGVLPVCLPSAGWCTFSDLLSLRVAIEMLVPAC